MPSQQLNLLFDSFCYKWFSQYLVRLMKDNTSAGVIQTLSLQIIKHFSFAESFYMIWVKDYLIIRRLGY